MSGGASYTIYSVSLVWQQSLLSIQVASNSEQDFCTQDRHMSITETLMLLSLWLQTPVNTNSAPFWPR